MQIDQLLSNCHIPFERLSHPTAYTANRVAQMLHVNGKDVAKCVLLKGRRGYFLAVLPASYRIDLDRIGWELGEGNVEMAAEEEIRHVFPDCEVGAMPPFGSLYHLPTYVDETLADDERIVFEAQCHEEAIRMNYRDYEDMEHPVRGHFASRG